LSLQRDEGLGAGKGDGERSNGQERASVLQIIGAAHCWFVILTKTNKTTKKYVQLLMQ